MYFIYTTYQITTSKYNVNYSLKIWNSKVIGIISFTIHFSILIHKEINLNFLVIIRYTETRNCFSWGHQIDFIISFISQKMKNPKDILTIFTNMFVFYLIMSPTVELTIS